MARLARQRPQVWLFGVLLLVAALAVPFLGAYARAHAHAHVDAPRLLARSFPLFKQCDPRWANDSMGVPKEASDSTICKEGCAISSLAMALNGHGVPIPVPGIASRAPMAPADPGVLNKWLRAIGGYKCVAGNCNNLVLDAPEKLAPDRIRFLGEPQVPFLATLRRWAEDPALVILAHVRHPPHPGFHHFVLIVGPGKGTDLLVQDPFYNCSTYSIENMHDVIVYNVI